MKKKQKLCDFPEILKEWDYSLNNVSDPSIIAARSQKKYYWICPKGHPSYLCSPDKKTSRNYGCPVCSNHKILIGINDLKTLRPDLMVDWDYEKNTINPEKVSVGSSEQVFWKCHKCGHEWKSEIRRATNKNINCPKCSLIVSGEKRHLAALKVNGGVTDKKLLLDWDYSKNKRMPSETSPQSEVYIHWKCHVCGYEWAAKMNNRTNGRGCPCCSNRVTVKGINDLATTHPKLVKEWHPTKNGNLTPSDVTHGSNKKVWWICPNGHEYQATILHRTTGIGTNCPICNSGRQTSFREQALFYYVKKLYPKTVSRYKPELFGKFELDIFIPELNFAIEYDGVAWHKEAKYEREQRKYELCKKLGIKLIRVKEKLPNEIGLLLADEIISSDDFESEQGFTFVIHQVLERLTFDDIYVLHPMDVNLTRDRFEIMKYATVIKHSFADVYPNIAKEWHPTKNGTLRPNMFKPKSTFKAWWLCPKCGNEYEAPIERRATGSGCKKCYLESIKTDCPNNIAVLQYSLDGEFIKEWRSISFAGRELKISAPNIVKCLKGKSTQAGGYKWKYK